MEVLADTTEYADTLYPEDDTEDVEDLSVAEYEVDMNDTTTTTQESTTAILVDTTEYADTLYPEDDTEDVEDLSVVEYEVDMTVGDTTTQETTTMDIIQVGVIK